MLISTSTLIPKLEERLQSSLPGWEAQSLLSPIKTAAYRTKPDHAQNAAVNLILYPNENQSLDLIFIKRQNHNPHDKHGGQISFPGGKEDSVDSNLIETALRETSEEIGIESTQLKILGQLSPLYVYVSNFYVYPIVSYLHEKPKLILQPSEVADVINQDLNYFLQDNAVQHIDFRVRDFIMKEMPHYKLQNHILWGATAMITSEFVQIIKDLQMHPT